MKDALEILARRLGTKIAYFEQMVSTNDTASQGEYTHEALVVAEFQSGGRGQAGRGWESELGRNLTFSLVLKPDFLMAEGQFMICELVSLALVDTLAEYGVEAQVKWPNDIYVGDKKTAGILIENDIYDSIVACSIVGIGLNVNQLLFNNELPNPISIRGAKGGDTISELDRVEVLGCFMSAFTVRYSTLLNAPETLHRDYLAHLYLRNVPHTYKLPDGRSFVGIIRRVEPTGELVVEHPDGSSCEYLFREIGF